jgi:putative oxidoreductase
MLGLAVLRLVVGGTFMAHGAQKLFGWFGGYGPEGTGQFFEEGLHLAPGKRNAIAAGASEFGGGALLAIGAAIPLASAALTATMTTAVLKVHKEKGFFVTEGGFEYNLVLLASVFAIAADGPGPLALRADEHTGPLWALASLGAGAVGGWAAIEVGHREYAKRNPPSTGDAQADGAAPAPAPESAAA